MTFRISNTKKITDIGTPTNSSNKMVIYETDIQKLRQALLNPSKYYIDGFRVHDTELQYATLVSLINKSFYDSIGNPASTGTSANIAEDGTEIAFGFPYSLNGAGIEVGRVDIHHWDGQKWIERESLYGITENGRFGRSVAISGDGSVLIVGSSKAKNSTNVETGSVNIYQWNGSGWATRGPTIYGQSNASFTGYSCDISSDGNTIIFGSYGAESQTGLKTGSVDVYQWAGTYWANRGPTFYGSVGSEHVGKSVCISPDGNTIAYGAPGDVNQSGVGVGTVRLYEWNGVQWVQKGTTIYGDHEYASAGDSVNISSDGNVLVYGTTQFEDANGVVIGKVDVVVWDGSGWVPKGDSFLVLLIIV